jgi:subtilisin family serine protease
MKYIIKYLIILLISFLVNIKSYGQNKKYEYLIEIDSTINLTQLKTNDNYINIKKLDSVEKEDYPNYFYKIKKFNNLLTNLNVIKARKLLRKLNDTTQYLYLKNGRKVSVEFLQRIYVVEIYDSLNEEKIKKFKEENQNLKNIDLAGYSKVSTWPPNDPYYIYQQQFYSTNYNINLPGAWRYTNGNSEIKVAIVDHGISYSHEDLGNGFGQGYRVRGGWDFKDNDAYPLPVFEENIYESHGTPIAGIIGALNNNSTGIVGIAGGWETVQSGCQLFSFRVSSDEVDEDGKRLLQRSLIFEALPEIAADPSVNNGYGYNCSVINCSFGGSCYYQLWDLIEFNTCKVWDWSTLSSQIYYNAFYVAYLLGATIVASRGNDGDDVPLYPSSYSNANILLSVSALDNNGVIYDGQFWSSSFGDGVTISAPAYINKTTYVTASGNSYNSFGGTSNSAPFVSGTAALVLSKLKEREIESLPDDIIEILKISSEDAGTTGYDDYYGWGRLNAGQAVHISSKPFILEHFLIEEDLDIQEVDFPDPQIISFYYPFSSWYVENVYRIRGTFTVPDYYNDLDSVWVWANQYTWGFPWGNPSYSVYDAALIDKDGRDWTFETYVYYLRTIDGGQTVWAPNHYNQSSISISILGKSNACTSNVYLSDIYINKPDCYKAKYILSAGQDVILDAESDVLFTAGEEIKLLPGFKALSGSKFVAKIEDCYLIQEDQIIKSIDEELTIVDKNNKINYHLSHNIPNPFSGITEIKYSLPTPSPVVIQIYNAIGMQVAELVNSPMQNAGEYSVTFDANDLPDGIYFYTMRTPGFTETKQMVLMR